MKKKFLSKNRVIIIIIVAIAGWFIKEHLEKQVNDIKEFEHSLKLDEEKIAKAKTDSIKAVTDSIAKSDSIKAYEATLPRMQYDTLQPGEGIFQVMERMNLSHSLIMNLINKLRFETELVSLIAGEKFTGVYTPDSTKLIEFRYIPNRVTEHRLLIDTATDSISYQLIEKPTVTRFHRISGKLKEGSTLNQSLLDSGLPQSITQVVNGILLCKISFRTDARVKDTFNIIIQEELYNDSVLNWRTKVLYASYQGKRAGFHEAYRYSDCDSKSTYNAHYTENGEALINSGLRFPVDRIHISSPYGMRIHPVTGKRKLHAGIDYAGPVGTPIYAVAAGKVVLNGYDKYSGQKLAIKHSDGFKTYYLHLNKKLVSVGQHVRSRQEIGKMGKTGRVTGPHLHFGIKKPNGKWMNPKYKKMIATPKLKGKRLSRLKMQIAKIKEISKSLKKIDIIISEDKVDSSFCK